MQSSCHARHARSRYRCRADAAVQHCCRRSQYPIGGDHGANDGIDQVADYLKTLPSGTVVYDHWLAWELGYYLGDGFVYLAYFDTPAALADDLRVFGGARSLRDLSGARSHPTK